MKTIIFFLLVSFISPPVNNGNIEISDEKVKVIFNRKTSFNELVKIKLDLAEKGITINYKKIVFTDFDELNEISFQVDCNDGFKGSAANPHISNNEEFGFVRYLEKDIFATGDISDY